MYLLIVLGWAFIAFAIIRFVSFNVRSVRRKPRRYVQIGAR